MMAEAEVEGAGAFSEHDLLHHAVVKEQNHLSRLKKQNKKRENYIRRYENYSPKTKAETIEKMLKGYKHVHWAGRPPWYDSKGKPREPYIIGICGGTASGKTSVCKTIIKQLNLPWVVLLSQDSFYKSLDEEQRKNASEYNFDHPNSFDWEPLLQTILDLKQGKSVEIPVYDFKTHSRLKETKKIYGADVIILEGILVFYSPELRKHMDMKIFVDTDSDIRLCRRLKRDIAERGRNLEDVINQYIRFVKPSFEDFILPTMQHADIIIPRGADNDVAISLIVDYISRTLTERGLGSNKWETRCVETVPPNVHVETTPQMQSLLSILRKRETKVHEFAAYSDKVVHLLLEKALKYLPWSEPFQAGNGIRSLRNEVCAISIMRGGTCMENALLQRYKDIPTGKILIQSDGKKNPRLFYLELPPFKPNQHVLLLDPTLETGATVIMAIRTLLDHQVSEKNILLVSVLAATQGLQTVCSTYPQIKIVLGDVDVELDENGFIVPGMGNFTDRYFGNELN